MTQDAPAERHVAPLIVHGAYLVVSGPPGAPLVVGCHGYGETAEHHLAEMRNIAGSERYCLCSIEAPHPFYRRSGEVVRSWMTREDRELAIEDNIRYVTSVITAVRREQKTGPGLFFTGFSQGAAMAWRGAVRCGLPVSGLMVLAGDVPPDIAELDGAHIPPVLLARGDTDAWYDEAKMDADLATLEKLGAEVELLVFSGGHEWSEPFHLACGRMIDRSMRAQ